MLVPPWQLDAAGWPLPGLGDVREALPVWAREHVFDVVVWATGPSPALDGSSPREWLTAGADLDVLIAPRLGLPDLSLTPERVLAVGDVFRRR